MKCNEVNKKFKLFHLKEIEIIFFFYFIFVFVYTASINAIACPFGGLLCSYVLDKYGRKKTLYTINILSIISWGIMAMASSVDKELMFVQLLVARFIIGNYSPMLTPTTTTTKCKENLFQVFVLAYRVHRLPFIQLKLLILR